MKVMRSKEYMTRQLFRSISRRVLITVLFILSVLLTMDELHAQQRNPQRGYQAGNSYAVSEIENINLSNGNLIMNIPLASLPAGRGTAPGYTVALKYNSKLWNSRQERRDDGIADETGNTSYMRELLELSDQGGWYLDAGGHQLETISRLNSEAQVQCVAGSGSEVPRNAYRFKLEMRFPDGSVKEFRPFGDGVAFQDAYEDGWFSIDPNGTRHTVGYMVWNGIPSCNATTSQITTGGMNYYTNDGSGIRLYVPYGQYSGIGIFGGNWKMYYPDGRVIENRPPDDATVTQRITERNGSRVTFRGSNIEDDAGRSISVYVDSNGDTKISQKGFGGEIIETTVKWKSYWIYRNYRTTSAPNSPSGMRYEDAFESFSAVDKIILPTQAGSLEYNFTYAASATQPTSGNYTAGWGELKSVIVPTGAKADYFYQLDGNAPIFGSFDVLNNAVTQKDLTYQKQYDGTTETRTETWYYAAGLGAFGNMTSPDGSTYNEMGDLAGNLKGYAYRTTSATTITEKIWAHNVAPRVSGSSGQAVNPYVKTEFTSIRDASGNPTLTAIRDFTYDKNGNVIEIREYDWVAFASIPRQTNASDPIIGKPTGIPSGAVLKRTTVNEYYNPTPTATDTTTDSPNHYANPSSPKIKGVIKSTEIRDSNNFPVARSEFYYDDANNTGNLTETRVWDSNKNNLTVLLTTANAVISTAQYNQYGSPTLTTDARGIQTQITYGNIPTPTGTISNLYPTQVISAYGTTIAQTAQSEYDFSTGLPKKVTAVGNTTSENVSSETVYDALGRPTIVKAAMGTAHEIWTRTEYSDSQRRVIVRSDLFAKEDGKKIAVQHYDQLGRVRLSRTIENAATENPYDEQHGIKVQTRYETGNPYSYQLSSNPYRANYSYNATSEESMGWTRSKSINTGRHSEVETFTGATLPAPFGSNTNSTGKVQTNIDANRTLVTDQAGKQRISKTNALGQLTDIWEITTQDSWTTSVTFPNQSIGHGYQTSYQYDTLNNLTTVSQGTQTRNFTYSSLLRLLSATNPESGIINYVYDNGGNLTSKTDARQVVTNYIYDALNRVTNRNYSAPQGLLNYQATPNVSYFYDDANVAFSKGKLTKVSSAVSETKYTQFDNVGRVLSSQQITDGQSYNSSYVYNLSGAILEQTYPSGRVVKNTLDQDGELSQVQSRKANDTFKNYANSFNYTAAGAVSSMRLGNGRWENTAFNNRLQPTQIGLGTSANNQSLLKLDYDYGTTDNNGNVKSQTITVPTIGASQGFTAVQAYTYDSLNRLKSAVENINGSQTPNWKQTFTFDRYGNRRFDTANGNTTTLPTGCAEAVCNPQVDPTTNKLIGTQFDSAGNTKTDANGQIFIYDAENKQVKVQNGANTIGEYFYDGDGKRIKKIVPNTGEITIFVYDAGGKMVAEYSTIVEPQATAKISYLTNDHLGSPRIISDQNGAVVSRRDFLPFGEEISRPNQETDNMRQKFTGYERDLETDLDFAQARYYTKIHGRFSSPDDFLNDSDTNDPQSWNKYCYVRNNPLNLIDPNGMKAEITIETDKKNKTGTITVRAKFAIYKYPGGNVDLEAQKKALKSQIESAYSGSYTKNGITYQVSAVIDVQIVESEADAIKLGESGKVDNIVGVCECNQVNVNMHGEGSSGEGDAVSYGLKNESFDRMVVASGASPENNDRKLYAHEFGHLLGVEHHQGSVFRGGRINRTTISQDDGEAVFSNVVQSHQNGLSPNTDRSIKIRGVETPLPPSGGKTYHPVRSYQYKKVSVW